MRDRIGGGAGRAKCWRENRCLLPHAVLLIADGAEVEPGELAQVRLPAAARRRAPPRRRKTWAGAVPHGVGRVRARGGVRRALMRACARPNAFACGCVCACVCA